VLFYRYTLAREPIPGFWRSTHRSPGRRFFLHSRGGVVVLSQIPNIGKRDKEALFADNLDLLVPYKEFIARPTMSIGMDKFVNTPYCSKGI